MDDEKIEAARVGFKAVFNEALAAAPSLLKGLAMEVASEGATEEYHWLGATPSLREWIGERVIQKLRGEAMTVANKSWASGLEVRQEDLEDDKLAIIAPRIRALATAALAHYDSLIGDYLANGFATTKYGACYDGLPFFSASHKNGDGPTQSNLGTATLDDTGAFDNAMKSMLELVDENGEPLNVRPTHLVVGPKLRRTALELIKAERDASGASNVNHLAVELIISPKLVGDFDDYWYLVDTSKPVKPLVLQIRKAPTFVGVDRMDSPDRFLRGRLYFGAEARHACAFGLWELIYGSNGTT